MVSTLKRNTLSALICAALANLSPFASQAVEASSYPPPPGREQWKFVGDLAKREPQRFFWSRKALPSELDLSGGITVADEYSAGDNLKTALSDLGLFLADAKLPKNGPATLTLKRGKVSGYESYRVDVEKSGITITAEDDEGLRRGIYFLQDLIQSQEGAFLPVGKIERKPWIKNRISRCFFGPIKRPPFNRDELLDDIDYYPDEYLSKLAREGINGLWLTIEFRELAKTSFTERDPNAEKRLEKLRNTVEKCGRYGIKVWLFAIEPKSLSADDPLLAAHPEWKGARGWGNDYAFCTASESARQYLRESLADIFANVPNLGGLINISHGERITNCLSALPAVSDAEIKCPRCSKIPKWKVYEDAARAMVEGIRKSAPKAQLITWLYQPQQTPERAQWAFEIARHVPEGAILQYNFESGTLARQLGRWRCGGDYWLSRTDPSHIFRRVADTAASSRAELSAKIQVGCSHELATVPFIPTPGLLYEKYSHMKTLGCSSVMQCWYFGNYPGIMNEAAGKLAFEDFKSGADEFLMKLAKPHWGANAGKIIKIWKAYAEGYKNYPLSNNMQYYGPMHSGTVWPLYLDIQMRPLNPTWIPDTCPNGETIGEALENHTLEEALMLSRLICEKMESVAPEIENIEKSLSKDDIGAKLDIGLLKALRIQFESARNIFEFYLLRRGAYCASRVEGDTKKALKNLERMGEIVVSEIDASKRLAELCSEDSRLGFHSEAETHMYSKERLQWRADILKDTLNQIAAAKNILREGGKLPESSFEENAPKVQTGAQWNEAPSTRWKISECDGGIKFEAQLRGDYGYDEFCVAMLDAAGTIFPLTVKVNGNSVADESGLFETKIERSGDLKKLSIFLPDIAYAGKEIKPSWIFVRRDAAGSPTKLPAVKYRWPACETLPKWRLNIGPIRPDMFGKIIY